MEGTAREIGRFIFSADLVKPATGGWLSVSLFATAPVDL
jgi:hypothetical protein